MFKPVPLFLIGVLLGLVPSALLWARSGRTQANPAQEEPATETLREALSEVKAARRASELALHASLLAAEKRDELARPEGGPDSPEVEQEKELVAVDPFSPGDLEVISQVERRIDTALSKGQWTVDDRSAVQSVDERLPDAERTRLYQRLAQLFNERKLVWDGAEAPF